MRPMTQSGSIPIRAGSAGARMLTMGLLFGLPAAHAADYKIVYAFQGGSDGAGPIGKLTPETDALYGATYGGGSACDCGTVYRVKENGAERVLHAFAGGSGDGAYPQGGLALLGDVFYGTTYAGGMTYCAYGNDNTCGTVYEITSKGAIRVIYYFQDGGPNLPSSDLIAAHGAVWGTSFFSESVFKTVPSGKTTSYSQDDLPNSALLAFGGAFYGTTQQGSSYCHVEGEDCGTIYRMTRDGQFSTVYQFTGGTDGNVPGGTLAHLHGALFGTSFNSAGGGTIFEISPSGVETTLHSFTGGHDGSGSNNGLLAYNGKLYGTTPQGGGTGCGRNGCGTIFSVTPAGAYTVLYRFAGGSDGQSPQGQLVAWRGFLYGTTSSGGGTGCNGSGCGTVFRIKP